MPDRGQHGTLGAAPTAPVHRGPGKMPWRAGPSKIRDPRTGLLKELPRSAMGGKSRRWGRPEVAGERCRSTAWFRVQALRYVAAAKAGDRNAKRYLKMVQMACHAFLQAKRAGIKMNDGIVLEREPTPQEARREAREQGRGKFYGRPCEQCASRVRYTTDARCASCRPGYLDR